MLNADYSSKFKKDLKTVQKRNLNMQKIFDVMTDIENEIPLQRKHNEHPLNGKYNGYLECHIEPDWLLIYKIDKQNQIVYFTRTGTHSDLFNP